MRWIRFLLVLLVPALAAAESPLFERANLVAWCIVPFDAKKRGPEERAAMLEKLELRKFAYDYRANHIPEWDAEMAALKRHGIELMAWWFPTTLNDEAKLALALFKRHGVRPQLWVMGGGGDILTKSPEDQAARIAVEVDRLRPLAAAAAEVGCQVALYNHGAWFGEPENAVAIVKALKAQGLANVGIVYNLHHGHAHLVRFEQALATMLPHLLCLNLNGMTEKADLLGQKIMPLGQGALDLRLLRAIAASGYQGPIGILNHTEEDAEGRLLDNLAGLEWLSKQLAGEEPGPKPKPKTWPEVIRTP